MKPNKIPVLQHLISQGFYGKIAILSQWFERLAINNRTSAYWNTCCVAQHACLLNNQKIL